MSDPKPSCSRQLSEHSLSFLALHRLECGTETRDLTFLLTELLTYSDIEVFSDRAEDSESCELTKALVVNYVSPIVKSDVLILN